MHSFRIAPFAGLVLLFLIGATAVALLHHHHGQASSSSSSSSFVENANDNNQTTSAAAAILQASAPNITTSTTTALRRRSRQLQYNPQPPCCTINGGKTCVTHKKRCNRNANACQRKCSGTWWLGGGQGQQVQPQGHGNNNNPSPAPPPSSSSSSLALQSCPQQNPSVCQAWLTAHNTRRATFHAAFGYTPQLLTWNTNLAASAAAFADQLAASCFLAHSGQPGVGENLAQNWGGNGQAYTPERVMRGWWDDEAALAVANNPSRRIGHFTQAAWYKTTRVGCATASSPDTDQCGHFHVCHYAGAGNCNIAWKSWQTQIFTNPVCS